MLDRRSLLAASLSPALGALASPDPPSTSATDALVLTPPMAMAPRADGVEFIWSVSRLSRGRVEFKLADAATLTASADPYGMVHQSSSILRVRLDGIPPGTELTWRAVTEAIDGDQATSTSPWKSFRTLDPAAAASSFVVWNDTHENHETIRALQARTPKADFLLWNGDTCNDWHQEGWLVPTLLAPAGLDISDGHPLLLTLGNHDVRGKFAFRVRDHIAMPHDTPYYAFRSGPVAVIGLHTGEDKPDDHPSFHGRVAFQQLREDQAQWLASAIAAPGIADAPYRIVFCHIPLRWIDEPDQVDYAGTGYDHYARSSRDLWHESLVTWGAQLVISGHTHRHAYLPPSPDFPYAQLTGGGPQPDRACWIEGHADAQALTLSTHQLHADTPLHQLSLPPLI
jgi:hypothetical protein